MEYRFHHSAKAPADRVEEHTRKKSRLLEHRLATFEPDLVRLDLRMDHRRKRHGERRHDSLYDAHLVLYLPGASLPNLGATGHGETWLTAINDAFDNLEDRLEKLLQELHHQSDIHDYQHRPSWERPGAELLGKPQAEPEPAEVETAWMEEWDQEHKGATSRPTSETS